MRGVVVVGAEDQHVGLAPGGAEVARRGWPGIRRLLQHRHRVRFADARFQCRQAALQGGGVVGRGDDDGDGRSGAAEMARVRGGCRH